MGHNDGPESSEQRAWRNFLLAHARVLRLDYGQWVEESKLSADGMPDVWFGETLLRHRDDAVWARLAADAPWTCLELHSRDKHVVRTFAVDDAGTVWMNEDEMLYASTAPPRRRENVTEDTLVQGRQQSLLRGGSYDATGEPPNAYGAKNCSGWYAIMVRTGKEMALDTQVARIAAALKGKSDLAAARFSIVREGDLVFFGANVPTWDMGKLLLQSVERVITKADGDVICARPPATREVKLDLTAGKISE